ncbi:hypothetical protein TNIN_121291 [Trichonephila inaurata madagascariensis]|uniref:Uncharacterized protein n=1 Tax=Trichonephila inaurata madagascariensis TaxID=2747483 RepID=A0A8X6JAL7_9ARAC|nr:hypothetical protein TNIN_349951 [Trichonephila inaurata madagascariensis]GFY38501.1 hypothetical protein TNIN_121291 [Trichonephila inaurata madagascariensis]
MTRPSQSVEDWFEGMQAGQLQHRSNLENVLKHPEMMGSAKKIPLFSVNPKRPEIPLQKICKLLYPEKECCQCFHFTQTSAMKFCMLSCMLTCVNIN